MMTSGYSVFVYCLRTRFGRVDMEGLLDCEGESRVSTEYGVRSIQAARDAPRTRVVPTNGAVLTRYFVLRSPCTSSYPRHPLTVLPPRAGFQSLVDRGHRRF